MSNFIDILKRGKKRFKVKSKKEKYGKCEFCDRRKLLFLYHDNKKELWSLCDECINIFVKEE